MRPASSRFDRWVATGLGLATFALLLCTEQGIGFVRDEGYYFHAGEAYAQWFRDFGADTARLPGGSLLSDPEIVRHFDYNHEHPALMKMLFGLSHLLLSERWQLVRPAAGYRMPAFVLGGLLSAVLYLLGCGVASRRAAVFGVLAFWLVPRSFFDGHLAAFDMPVAAMELFVVYAYWRALASPRWSIATGLLFGLAVSTKHNAWFLPPVLLIHFLMTQARPAFAQGGLKALAKRASPFWAMALGGPVLFYALWPYLWHDPWPRLQFYWGFHTHHIHYPWMFLGKLLMEPPFPLGYAFMLTALTVPLSLLVPMVLQLGRELARVAVQLYRRLPLSGEQSSDRVLLIGNALASLAIISYPQVPVFGGTKHWLPSMPFLCLFAGMAVDRASQTVAALWPRLSRAAFPGLATLLCAPALWACAHIHPYGTSYYNELAGGAPGAAALGMQRQFWSNNVTGVLPWLNNHVPPNGRVFFHEVNFESYVAYRENGMLRPDIQYAYGVDDADFVAYQYMQEFREQELEIWNKWGTRSPAFVLYIDEIPNVTVYRRPGR